MKKFLHSRTIFLLAAGLGLLLVTGSGPRNQQAAKTGNAFSTVPATDHSGLFYPGMITLKVTKGTVLQVPQEGTVTFGIPSLDAKISEFGIHRLGKRFIHRPIPENSGLPDLSRIYLVEYESDIDPETVSNAFGSDPAIEYAEPVPICRLTAVPDDPLYSQQQHLPQVMAEEAWEIHKGEEGTEEVVVAIIDTGVDWQHPDLTGNCWQNTGEDADGDGVTLEYDGAGWVLDPDDLNGIDDDNNGYVDDLIGWNFYHWIVNGNGSNPTSLLDPSSPYYGHGTHVGSLAAGCTNNSTGVSSISWNVKYMPVQACNLQALVSWGFDGIVYAAENGADIISNSYGGFPFSQTHAEVIAYAHGLGSIVVCAAGNDWDNLIIYPASYPFAVSVAAVSLNDVKCNYSNFGASVDLCAPGGGWEGGILSAVPNGLYGLKGGTSMATPVVSGVMALVKSYHPDWTNNEVIAQVTYTTDNIDTLNPTWANLLGSGRINAFRALAETNVVIPQELEFGMISRGITDNDGNKIFEPCDTVSLNFQLRNFNPFVGDDNVTFSLVSDDPDLLLLNPSVQADVEPDGTVVLDMMGFVVSPAAQHHMATLTLHIESALPVTAGEEFSLNLAIAPSGILLYDEFDKDHDMSGTYMLQFFRQLGLEATYTCSLPVSLTGYESVFVSLENPGRNLDQSNLNNAHLKILRDYLVFGGNLYVESCGFFMGLQYVFPSYSATMRSFFGVASVTCPTPMHLLSNMTGVAGTPMEGMAFSTSHQEFNWNLNAITPSSFGTCPFQETGYGNVAVYRAGTTHKAFYLGYSLYELEDVDATSSRYNLLLKILEFFGTDIPEGYVAANFKAENAAGGAPLEVHFSDISKVDENAVITSRAWDFNGDGTIDSNEENPVFTYDDPGHYDVMLIITSQNDSDTLVMEDCIHVNQGVFVYEMREGERNYSGTWMYDFLTDHGIVAEYSTSLPHSFLGYDAVFLSQGIHSYLQSTTPDGIVPVLTEYLGAGGNVYLEGADALGRDLYFQPQILPWFGLAAASDGFYNPLENLTGMEGSLAEGLFFESSDQTVYGNQDTYNTMVGGQIALKEAGIYPVAVQYAGDAHKTFCFSYALAELEDNEGGTREALFTAILNFFGIVISGDEETPWPSQQLAVYPNPFSGSCTLGFSLVQGGTIDVAVYDISGKRIQTLLSGERNPGSYSIAWNASTLENGIYLVKLTTGLQTVTQKVVHVKNE